MIFIGSAKIFLPGDQFLKFGSLFLPFMVPPSGIWSGLLQDLETILQPPKVLMQPKRTLTDQISKAVKTR